MNETLTKSFIARHRTAKTIEPIKLNDSGKIKRSRSNANIFSQTCMNVYTKKAMSNIGSISKQSQAKRRNRHRTDYQSEYNKQFSQPRSIPQVIKNQYMTHHVVDTNRILFPDDEYDNEDKIFSSTAMSKGKKRYGQLHSSGSITELFSKSKETQERRKISGKLNEETGIFSAKFKKMVFKKEKARVDLVKIKSDCNYAGNFNSVYGLWYKLSVKTRNKQLKEEKGAHKELNASDYAKMIKLKSRESDLFGTHTAIPRSRQGKQCNYFNRSMVF